MAVRKLKPTSPGVRAAVRHDFTDITTDKPHKPLLVPRKNKAGRNSRGKITVRHRGGGHKRNIRIIDFKRDKFGVSGKVLTVEYDPNRSARIALVGYSDGDKRYIIAPSGVKVGMPITSGKSADIKTGNSLPLDVIPAGTQVHNIELRPGRGGQMVRSAGSSAQVMAREEKYTLLRMPSGEIRKIESRCMATIGQVGNLDHKNTSLGKAGKSRHKGFRPTVRGSAMTPRDHPHGGGEGRAPIGLKHPKTPWGKPALGRKTRTRTYANKLILRKGRKR